MQIGPIISSLRRHKTAAALIIIEIAVTCAIVSNAVFLINQRIDKMQKPSGVVESELAYVHVAGIKDGLDRRALSTEDLVAIRSIPGVKSTALANQVPFGGSSWNSSVRLTNDDSEEGVNAATFLGSEDLLETFGVNLIAGRDFKPDEYVDFDDINDPDKEVTIPAVILSEALAIRMFGNEDALGKSLYVWGDEPHRVVGVIERLRRPGRRSGKDAEISLIFPIRPFFGTGAYYFRVEPSQKSAALEQVAAVIQKNNPNRIILTKRTFQELRDKHFAGDRSMAYLLVAVCLALLLITALGIVGLASFWVQQRTRQIGIRRALGANRTQILRYFQTENLLLASVGIFVGMMMAYGVNALLMKHYEVARLPASYLPIGAIALVILCQIAVLGPARRAARVPPAVATRGA